MLKNNNKGYFLAETIIVLTVVALAITTLYVNSMESYVKEKNDLTKYNTVDGLYSANAVKKYLYKYVNDFKVNANTNGYIDVNNYLDGRSIKVSNVTFFKELNVKQIYFSTYDMTKLISSDILAKNIKNELSNIENDSKCVYRYVVIYNDYSYSLVGVGCGEEDSIPEVAKFNYTGSTQTYTVPANGYYKVEAWGAQGGNSGGKGAYTYGEVYLKKGTTLYIQVGGQGSNNPAGVLQSVTGGYNGGGGTEGQNCCSRSYGTGGGATDIRLSGGAWNDDLSLKSRIMVAAGGGGRFTEGTEGGSAGAGGALNGLPGSGKNENYCVGLGGTQTSAGTISTTGENCDVTEDAGYTDPGKSFGGFGYGGKHGTDGNNSTGGGGGYYGGSSSGHIASAGGGSSYVSGYAGCVAIATSSSLTPKTGCTDGTTNIECSYHYSGTIFQNAKIIAGNDKMPNHEGTGTMTGNSGNGYAQISYCGVDQASCNSLKAEFNYTGSEQSYVAPADGYYNLEVWGAQGDVVADVGYGGYSTGSVKLNKGDTLYVVVGQKGQYNGFGGYNGGGRGSRNNDSTYGYSTGGGGATHIASVKGTLSSIGANNKNKIYIVSGGGGGHSGYNNNGSGGSAGGYIGNIGTGQTATGGSQTSGGSGSSSTAGNFGLGGSIILGTHSAGGGGSGFYGGGATGNGGGAGGSGYIGNSLLTNKVMYCYKCTESSDISTKTVSTTNVSERPLSNYAKKGNGYAKISYCGNDSSSCNSLKAEFNYTGSTQVYTVPTSGYYKMEAWGAQGGSVTENGEIPKAEGGKGAYTYGEIYLESGTNLYIQVGGQGSKSAASIAQDLSGGYNGGGGTKGQNCCSRSFGTGGGATDIRLSGGAWNDLSSLKSRIMVAAGGGGAFNGTNVGSWSNPGGYGGGLHGGDGSQGTFEAGQWCNGLGATQTSGGKITTDCEKSDNFNGEKTGSFGIGGGYSSTGEAVTGGGGGYYGGSKSGHIASAGGGSSFISGYKGCVAISSESSLTPKTGCTDGTTNIECSYHYSGKKFQNAKMIAGNDKMPNHEGTGTMTGNSGNGYVKISYCGTNQSSCKSN